MTQQESASETPISPTPQVANPPRTKERTTRQSVLFWGGWGYGITGILVLIVATWAWIAWQFASWHIPFWVEQGAVFAGLIGTGLTIAGIGIAVHESLPPKTLPLEQRIEAIESKLASLTDDENETEIDALTRAVNELHTSVEALAVEVASVPKNPCTIWKHSACQGKRNR